MSLQQVEEEEYEVGSPAMFCHLPLSCMSSAEPLHFDADVTLRYGESQGGHIAVKVGMRVLIDEAP